MYRVLWHESAYYCTIRAAVLCACISRTHMHVFKLRALPSVCVHVLGVCAVRALFTKPKHAPALSVAATCAHMCVHFVNGVCTFAIRNVPLIKAASCVRLDAKSPQSADIPLKTWSSQARINIDATSATPLPEVPQKHLAVHGTVRYKLGNALPGQEVTCDRSIGKKLFIPGNRISCDIVKKARTQAPTAAAPVERMPRAIPAATAGGRPGSRKPSPWAS